MRNSIPNSRLARLVCEEIRAQMAGQHTFTAYDITRALRARHRDVEIRHDPVRNLVHRYMEPIVGTGQYQDCLADFEGNIAVLYAPMPPVTLAHLRMALLN